jgi:hypothetical protein
MHYKTIIIKLRAITVSGNFNSIHNMQIEYFQNAKTNGDKLFVSLHSELRRSVKGSKEFQDKKSIYSLKNTIS